MWFNLEPVQLNFMHYASTLYVVESDVALPRSDVWNAIVDAPGWSRWFPGVRSAAYRGAPPYGVGTVRIADVGGFRMEETVLAWDEGTRWAYRIDRSTVPLAKAQLESTELEDRGTGTRVRWSLAIEPGVLMTLARPFLRTTVERLLQRAMRNLERDVTARRQDALP